jgi:hypothetical protein
LPGSEGFFVGIGKASDFGLVSKNKRFAWREAGRKDQIMWNKYVSALAVAGIISLSPTLGRGEVFVEDFSSDPFERGWQTFGNSSLFEWNAENQALEVFWDSSEPNSYFHRPLGASLDRQSDFSLAFELRLQKILVGTTPGKPFSFQLAIGFLNLESATAENYFRASGTDSPNLVEFNYFPDSGFGATIAPVIISSNHQFAASFNFPIELTPEDLFRVEMVYLAANQTLTTTILKNGEPFEAIDSIVLDDEFDDFSVDHIAVKSYNDEGQHPDFGGSIQARGTVEYLRVATALEPIGRITGGFRDGAWEVQFESRAGWTYALERTMDFLDWSVIGEAAEGTGAMLALRDESVGLSGFYRVRAQPQ